MYKVTKSDMPALQKRINAIGRKLDKYGLKWRFEIIGESAEHVNVYAYNHEQNCQVKTGEAVLDVVSYEFEMESLKLGEWKPLAVIEHMALIESGNARNMVHGIGDGELSADWWTADSNCVHCNNKRRRNKTVILQSTNGELKQVGTTCIKDFTGIDAADIISLYADIQDIFIEEPRCYDGGNNYASEYVSTFDYLAHCIALIKQYGYNKDWNSEHCTKVEAWRKACHGSADNEATIEAKNIISFFASADRDDLDGFGNNIKSALGNEFSKMSGIVAYAPVAYPKTLEAIKAKQERDTVNAISQWQGNIGEKISIEVTFDRSVSYQTEWGTSYIHLFKDAAGNIYKWSTGKSLYNEKVDGIIKGTIKDHNEYNGQKQTVLTRCKVS